MDMAVACETCGFGFLFELMEDYYPGPNTGFVVCDQEGRVLALGRGVFELTGYRDADVIGRDVGRRARPVGPRARGDGARVGRPEARPEARAEDTRRDDEGHRRGLLPRLRRGRRAAGSAGAPLMPEVAVVGGGVMGASIAYHLAAAGIDDVVLYERHALASGPTGRSTALIRLHYSQPLLVRMAAAGLALYSSSRAAVGFSSGFTRVGLLVGAPEDERAALEHNVAVVRGEGAESQAARGGGRRATRAEVAHRRPRLRVRARRRLLRPVPRHGRARRGRAPRGRLDRSGRPSARSRSWMPVWSSWRRARGHRPAAPSRVRASAPGRTGRGGALPPAAVVRLSPARVRGLLVGAALLRPARDGGILEVGGLDPEHAEHPIDPEQCPAERDARDARGHDGAGSLPGCPERSKATVRLVVGRLRRHARLAPRDRVTSRRTSSSRPASRATASSWRPQSASL